MTQIRDLPFLTMRRDQGQIVTVSYFAARGGLVRHVFDASDRTERFECRDYAKRGRWEFEPQNGQLPATKGKWHPLDGDAIYDA